MRFSGVNNLNAAIFIREDLCQALGVAEQQRAALVRRKAAREANRQHFRIENFFSFFNRARRSAGALELELDAFAGPRHQARAAAFVDAPQFRVGDHFRAAPLGSLVPRVERPARATVAHEQFVQLIGDVGADVTAIGDVADRHFVDRHVRPNARPHCPRHFAVELGDAVGGSGGAQRQDRQRERFALVVRIDAAQREEGLAVDAQLAVPIAEVTVHEIDIENFISGRNGRVRGENIPGDAGFERFVELQSLFFDQNAHALQRGERRVAFVHVDDFGLASQRAQRPHATDAEQNFLLEAVFVVATVKLVGDGLVFAAVRIDFRVEQIQRNASDLDFPDLRPDFAPRVVHGNQQRLAVRPGLQFTRQIVEIVRVQIFLLIAFMVQVLAEITVVVEETHGDERDAERGRGLQMIAGEQSQTTGVNREAFVQAEFGAEISDRRSAFTRRQLTMPCLAGHVFIKT